MYTAVFKFLVSLQRSTTAAPGTRAARTASASGHQGEPAARAPGVTPEVTAPRVRTPDASG